MQRDHRHCYRAYRHCDLCDPFRNAIVLNEGVFANLALKLGCHGNILDQSEKGQSLIYDQISAYLLTKKS